MKNLQVFVDSNGYIHGYGGFLGIWKHYEANFDNSYLNVVGEATSYTGDVTTDSWVDVTPATMPNDNVDADSEMLYLGNNTIILPRQAYGDPGPQYTPYISYDGGKTWTECPSAKDYIKSGACVYGVGKILAIKQINGVVQGFYISEDYGTTWTQQSVGFPFQQTYTGNSTGIVYAGIDGQEQHVFLMGTQPNGLVLKSVDYGVTWTNTRFNATSDSTNIFAGDDGVILAWSHTQLYRSSNFGLTWNFVGNFSSLFPNTGLFGQFIGTFFKGNNGRIIASAPSFFGDGKIFYSDNGGETWAGGYADGSGLSRDCVAFGNNQIMKIRNTSDGSNNINYVSFSTDNGASFGTEIALPGCATDYISLGSAIYSGNGQTVIAYGAKALNSSDPFKTKIMTLGTW